MARPAPLFLSSSVRYIARTLRAHRASLTDVRNEEDALQASGLSVPKKKGLDKLRIDGSHSALGQFSLYAKEGALSYFA